VIGPGDRTVAEATITYVILDRDSQRPLPIDGEIRESLGGLPGAQDSQQEER
jgi:acyl-CoA thioesterase FadM